MIDKPLAFRMRPEKIEEVLGQEKIKAFLNNLLENRALVSMIFYGPPGTGKTTLAQAFANSFDAYSVKLNAVLDNKSRMEAAFQEAIRFNPAIVIIDEIHRLDKGKQDLLLPHLENGDFYLIGCTTANPLISLNPAIRSRTRLLESLPLSKEDILTGLERALESKKGLSGQREFDKDGLEHLASMSSGDLRFAYNQLEAIALSFSKSHRITLEDVRSVAIAPNYLTDKDEDEHYDTVSALQKSIRGSDVDAAVYYLAKLLKGGDLEGLIRRLLVTAYEDVGLANPQAVDRCYHACLVAREVGMPEAMIPLSFSVCDLALSPKSKASYQAVQEASALIDEKPTRVRSYLRLKTYGTPKEEQYDYSDPEVWSHLVYLPEGMEGLELFHGWGNGKYERALMEQREKLRALKKATSIKEAKRIALESKKK